MTHGTQGFWPAMGPFFCSRAIAAELGGPVYSDPGRLWLVAFVDDEVVGWMSVIPSGGAVTIDWAWVTPSHRGQGVYRMLEAEALTLDPESKLYRATRLPWLAERWLSQGFNERTRRGSWRFFWRDRA